MKETLPNPKEKWNRIYMKDTASGKVAAVLQDNVALLPTTGLALDIACGTGGNSLFLAERGMTVDAWDISDVVIQALREKFRDQPKIRPLTIDIRPDCLPEKRYDLVLTCHYLDRTLAPAIMQATRPGGLVIYQTFTSNKVAAIGPETPAFLLRPNELEQWVAGCELLASADGSGIEDIEHPLAGRAYVIARKAPENS